MLRKHNFYCKAYPWNETYSNDDGEFRNEYEDNADGTITDHATGLMWQQGASPDYGVWNAAQPYIDQLNAQHFAGYCDWRLPTLEELASQVSREALNKGLYVSPLFSDRMWFWSCDPGGPGSGRAWTGSTCTWAVNFDYGSVFCLEVVNAQDIRGVRAAAPGPGRKLYQDYRACLLRGDLDRLLLEFYLPDSEIVCFGSVLRGASAMKPFLAEIARDAGESVLVSFAESDSVIQFKTRLKANPTEVQENAFVLKAGRIEQHLSLSKR